MPGTGRRGDLYLNLRLQPHPIWRLDGDQLRAGFLQKAHALNHMGQGAFTAGHIGAGAVGNAGIVAQQGGDVLLVNRGGRQRRQA